MVLFTQSVKKSKGATDINGDFDGKCEQGGNVNLSHAKLCTFPNSVLTVEWYSSEVTAYLKPPQGQYSLV